MKILFKHIFLKYHKVKMVLMDKYSMNLMILKDNKLKIDLHLKYNIYRLI